MFPRGKEGFKYHDVLWNQRGSLKSYPHKGRGPVVSGRSPRLGPLLPRVQMWDPVRWRDSRPFTRHEQSTTGPGFPVRIETAHVFRIRRMTT